MKKIFLGTLVLFILSFSLQSDTAQKSLKVFISVDMEGVSGVIHWEDVGRSGKDYGLFRKLMTQEANAAVEGALAAGATEILVRDSHGSARNILPDMLQGFEDYSIIIYGFVLLFILMFMPKGLAGLISFGMNRSKRLFSRTG